MRLKDTGYGSLLNILKSAYAQTKKVYNHM